MIYYATMIESQIMMGWKIILKEFGTNIQHIAGFDKMVAGNINKMEYVPNDQGKNINRRDQFCVRDLFTTSV